MAVIHLTSIYSTYYEEDVYTVRDEEGTHLRESSNDVRALLNWCATNHPEATVLIDGHPADEWWH